MKNHGKKIGATMCLMLFVGLCFSSSVSAGGENIKYESDKIFKATGTTDALGGGDYVYIQFKNDAGFGVLYGTEENPNSIIILAWHTRYLGGANVYDENGALIGQKIPIMVFTVFAQKLEDIFEFNDTNGDGIATYKKSGSGLFDQQYPLHEPIYKKVSLETAWTRSDVIEITDKDARERSWEFSLNAIELPYEAIGISDSINHSVEHEALERVEFTFHLTAGLISIDNQSIPYYRVTVRKEPGTGLKKGYTVLSSERIENRYVSGQRGLYTVKYDHEIEGWDFDPTNENKMLLLEFGAILGNVIPANVAEWIKMQFIKDIGGHGSVEYETDDGTEEATEDTAVNETEPLPQNPKRLRHRYIRCGGNWESIGNLTWISNVTVDGQEDQMYAQIQGHVRFAAKGPRGNVFAGFALLGGFSYPGGSLIIHDPSMSSEALIEMSFATPLTTLPWFIWIALGAVIVVLAVAAVSLYRINKGKKEQYFSESFDTYEPKPEEGPTEENWQKYYGKK